MKFVRFGAQSLRLKEAKAQGIGDSQVISSTFAFELRCHDMADTREIALKEYAVVTLVFTSLPAPNFLPWRILGVENMHWGACKSAHIPIFQKAPTEACFLICIGPVTLMRCLGGVDCRITSHLAHLSLQSPNSSEPPHFAVQ